MSTRGFIAREVDAAQGKFCGVYHHWDSYPSGLGATLFKLYNGHFNKDREAMLKVLIDDHNAWSTIDGDWNQAPGYDEHRRDFANNRPQCYCHGDRHEKNRPISEKDASGIGCEYGYVFAKDRPNIMWIVSSFCKDGSKMIGMFGSGDPNAEWKPIAEIDLNGEEPDWDNLLGEEEDE